MPVYIIYGSNNVNKAEIIINDICESALAEPVLREGQIAVWHGDIECLASTIAEFSYLLTDDERSRRDRFVRTEDQLRFACGRIFTRIIAGKYLSLPPGSINIAVGADNKPFIDCPARKLFHNVSHSGRFVLIAFSWSFPVGVDVEQVNHRTDIDGVCRMFHSSESAVIEGSGDFALFYRYWTAKEAFVKAVGRGLLMDFNSFFIGEDGMVYLSDGSPSGYSVVRLCDCEDYAEALSYKHNRE